MTKKKTTSPGHKRCWFSGASSVSALPLTNRIRDRYIYGDRTEQTQEVRGHPGLENMAAFLFSQKQPPPRPAGCVWYCSFSEAEIQ